MIARIIPLTLTAAKKVVTAHHRHNKAPVGGLFAAGLEIDGELVGVAIAGRPVARHLDDGYTIEVTRLCLMAPPGELPNAASRLYAAITRAAAALGYTLAVTYTRDDESGGSLRAAGWVDAAHVQARQWGCASRPREQMELIAKRRWERRLAKEVAT